MFGIEQYGWGKPCGIEQDHAELMRLVARLAEHVNATVVITTHQQNARGLQLCILNLLPLPIDCPLLLFMVAAPPLMRGTSLAWLLLDWTWTWSQELKIRLSRQKISSKLSKQEFEVEIFHQI